VKSAHGPEKDNTSMTSSDKEVPVVTRVSSSCDRIARSRVAEKIGIFLPCLYLLVNYHPKISSSNLPSHMQGSHHMMALVFSRTHWVILNTRSEWSGLVSHYTEIEVTKIVAIDYLLACRSYQSNHTLHNVLKRQNIIICCWLCIFPTDQVMALKTLVDS
jgi:hypothetical protein